LASKVAGEAMVVVVPGRVDRAFYKAFLRVALDLAGASVTDLDSSRARSEREDFLRKQVSLSRWAARAATLRADYGHATLRIAILDAEGQVVDRAADILNFYSGFRKPPVYAMAVTEDAEDRGFSSTLQSMYNALASRHDRQYDLGNLLEGGNTFRLYKARRPPITLLIIAQGVPALNIAPRHAVEDYVLYVRSEELRKLRERCKIGLRRALHKKLMLLLMIAHSYTKVEAFIHHTLGDSAVEKLLTNCPELAKLRDVALKALKRM